jgi:SAM-dependent methyltransferase
MSTEFSRMNARGESSLGRLYRHTYKVLCGQSPHERLWHFQWLSTLYLHRRLLRLLPQYGGRVLDVGCGDKPYRTWFGEVSEYVGLDVAPGPEVDVAINQGERWPLPNRYYDVLLSTQVIEHVDDLDFALEQMARVIKTGGVIILSFPFLFNLHGAPDDYRRFTHYGATKLLPGYEILHLEPQGGIGSTLVILFLNWIDTVLSTNAMTRILKGVLLPFFIVLSFLLNLLGLALDGMDRTASFYSNVLLVARKQAD